MPTMVKLTCSFCDIGFSRELKEYNKWLKKKGKKTFCSKSCKLTSLKINKENRPLELVLSAISHNCYKSNDECWIYPYTHDKDGYGQLSSHKKAHRVSWEYFNNTKLTNSKQFICHKCDNPPCINPNHLFLGDSKSNIEDKVLKGRTRKQVKTLSHLTENDILWIRSNYKNFTKSDLANKYSISVGCLYSIISNRSWKNLPKSDYVPGFKNVIDISKLGEEDIERFWNSFSRPSDIDACWEYLKLDGEGYGWFGVKIDGEWYKVRTHRITFYLEHKRIDSKLLIRHLCHNKKCCNPKHLDEGSSRDNYEDSRKSGNICVGSDNVSSKLTEAQVKEIRELYRNGSRITDLSRAYNVTVTNLRFILDGKTWKHVT